ncbi:MAG TPA: UDP-N-acetylmuramate--L-alanine ligase [Phycisphaerae bacterium]|nr:UDP-N-acetylmuramate--L-alanine ligase [Phycisphaerae bacterium]
MVGIGGCGMRGAAAVLLRRGALVSGTDRETSPGLGPLADQGACVVFDQKVSHLPADCDLVVRSAAVKDDSPDIVEARRRGLPILKYAELLGLLMADRAGVAIAGTHGKSTTTAMTAFVLRQAGVDPSFVVGAEVHQLGGGSGVGDGPHFVVEACEYDRSFLNLRARYAAILNLEEDHLDYYRDLNEIVDAFSDFASQVSGDGVLVVNGEDRHALKAAVSAHARIETFGFEGKQDWRPEILGDQRGCFRFRVLHEGRALAEVQLSIPGRHHVANALASMALCFHGGGIEPETIARAIGDFRGAGRRMTWHGCAGGVNVVDDYAHHPTELQVTIKAAREYYNPRKLYVVFQPHQHSRTRFLLNDFARSFGAADVVVVPDIYFVRDSQTERDLIDSRALVDRIRSHGGDARYEPGFEQIVHRLAGMVQPGDLVLTMGAGNVWQVADDLLRHLGNGHGSGH